MEIGVEWIGVELGEGMMHQFCSIRSLGIGSEDEREDVRGREGLENGMGVRYGMERRKTMTGKMTE